MTGNADGCLQEELQQSGAVALRRHQKGDQVGALPWVYISLGERICGTPALDREFKTVDFLTILDLASLPPEIVERYLS